MQEKEHVTSVLKQAKEAVKAEDLIKLKELSNQTIHSASILQDIDYILVAVIIYSLSKIIERTDYKNYPNWNSFFNAFMKHINYSIIYLEKNNIITAMRLNIVLKKHILKTIPGTDMPLSASRKTK